MGFGGVGRGWCCRLVQGQQGEEPLGATPLPRVVVPAEFLPTLM